MPSLPWGGPSRLHLPPPFRFSRAVLLLALVFQAGGSRPLHQSQHEDACRLICTRCTRCTPRETSHPDTPDQSVQDKQSPIMAIRRCAGLCGQMQKCHIWHIWHPLSDPSQTQYRGDASCCVRGSAFMGRRILPRHTNAGQ
ncbi:hypothetical protein BGZ57DRAFT_442958 [Hyaloscypha finlandica]|nr:hypothetical protein BGZ57DRAFT_442958 [Hyaloscypha finlandica]